MSSIRGVKTSTVLYHMVRYDPVPVRPVKPGAKAGERRRGEGTVASGFTAGCLFQGRGIRLDWVEVIDGVRSGAAKLAYAAPAADAGTFSVMA